MYTTHTSTNPGASASPAPSRGSTTLSETSCSPAHGRIQNPITQDWLAESRRVSFANSLHETISSTSTQQQAETVHATPAARPRRAEPAATQFRIPHVLQPSLLPSILPWPGQFGGFRLFAPPAFPPPPPGQHLSTAMNVRGTLGC